MPVQQFDLEAETKLNSSIGSYLQEVISINEELARMYRSTEGYWRDSKHDDLADFLIDIIEDMRRCYNDLDSYHKELEAAISSLRGTR